MAKTKPRQLSPLARKRSENIQVSKALMRSAAEHAAQHAVVIGEASHDIARALERLRSGAEPEGPYVNANDPTRLRQQLSAARAELREALRKLASVDELAAEMRSALRQSELSRVPVAPWQFENCAKRLQRILESEAG